MNNLSFKEDPSHESPTRPMTEDLSCFKFGVYIAFSGSIKIINFDITSIKLANFLKFRNKNCRLFLCSKIAQITI